MLGVQGDRLMLAVSLTPNPHFDRDDTFLWHNDDGYGYNWQVNLASLPLMVTIKDNVLARFYHENACIQFVKTVTDQDSLMISLNIPYTLPDKQVTSLEKDRLKQDKVKIESAFQEIGVSLSPLPGATCMRYLGGQCLPILSMSGKQIVVTNDAVKTGTCILRSYEVINLHPTNITQQKKIPGPYIEVLGIRFIDNRMTIQSVLTEKGKAQFRVKRCLPWRRKKYLGELSRANHHARQLHQGDAFIDFYHRIITLDNDMSVYAHTMEAGVYRMRHERFTHIQSIMAAFPGGLSTQLMDEIRVLRRCTRLLASRADHAIIPLLVNR
jgi:hypothetical protein